MNITTLKDLLTAAVANDSSLLSWSSSTYGSTVWVFSGIDTRKPPGEDKYPLVHIVPVGKSAGYGTDQILHRFSIVCGVNDASIDHATGYDNFEQGNGPDRVEAMRALVQTAIAAVIPAGCWIDRIDTEYDSVDYYPFHFSGMDITINQPLYQGDDPLA